MRYYAGSGGWSTESIRDGTLVLPLERTAALFLMFKFEVPGKGSLNRDDPKSIANRGSDISVVPPGLDIQCLPGDRESTGAPL